MDFTYYCRNDSNSIIYTLRQSETLDEEILKKLQEGRINCLLQVKRMVIGDVRLVYDLNHMVVLSAYLEGASWLETKKVEARKRKNLKYLVHAGVPLEYIAASDDFIYRNELDGDIYYICIPVHHGMTAENR